MALLLSFRKCSCREDLEHKYMSNEVWKLFLINKLSLCQCCHRVYKAFHFEWFCWDLIFLRVLVCGFDNWYLNYIRTQNLIVYSQASVRVCACVHYPKILFLSVHSLLEVYFCFIIHHWSRNLRKITLRCIQSSSWQWIHYLFIFFMKIECLILFPRPLNIINLNVGMLFFYFSFSLFLPFFVFNQLSLSRIVNLFSLEAQGLSNQTNRSFSSSYHPLNDTWRD